MRAFQGAIGIAPEAGVVSPDYAVLRVDSKVDMRWLNYYLTSGLSRVDHGQHGSTVSAGTEAANTSELHG